jgi:ribonuclease III
LAIKKLLSLLKPSGQVSDKNFKKWIKSISGYGPKNLQLYKQAFSHRSITTHSPKGLISNERLEFLGDAVLGAIVADHLFSIYSSKDEGFLTQLRSRIVNGQSLKVLAQKFGFNQFLKTATRSKEMPSSNALGDAFEAFIGALYLDHGFLKTKKFVISRVVKTHLDLDKLVQTNDDFKSQLQIYCQKNKLNLEYRLVSEELASRGKLYAIQVYINGEPYIRFESFNKRKAEQGAAQLSLETLSKSHG